MIIGSRVNITAHAGCMGTGMDSMESIEAGIKYGADIIEIDLNIDENRILVLSHDNPKPGVKYPGFEQVFNIMGKNKEILMNIDIKDIKILEKLNKIILDYGLKGRAFLTGLDFKDIVENKELLRESNYFINLDTTKLEVTKLKDRDYLRSLFDEFKVLNIMGVNINYRLVTAEMISVCKEKGMLSSVWTVDDVEEMKRLINFQVNSITTKEVGILRNLINVDGGNFNGGIQA